MPRQGRQQSQTNIYHIVTRGNERKEIFIDEEDKIKYLNILYEKKKNGEFELYAYCIMSNHVHLLLREGIESVSKVMKRIGTSYARYYNQKHERVGHVFQDRYKSENVENEPYFLSAIRYIHCNPEKAGICAKENYPWSSYQAYMDDNNRLIGRQAVNEVLKYFSLNDDDSISLFKDFSSQNYEEHMDLEDKKARIKSVIEVKEYIREYLIYKNIAISDLEKRKFKPIRDELLVILHENTDLSIRKISEMTGVNREAVRTAILSKEPSP